MIFNLKGESNIRKVVIIIFSILIYSGLTYASVPKTRTLDFDYEVILKDIPSDAYEVKIWLPLLPDNDRQIIEDITIHPSDSMVVLKDKFYGNKILHYTLTPPFDSTFKINVHYKLKRIEYSNKSGNGNNIDSVPEENTNLDKFLKIGVNSGGCSGFSYSFDLIESSGILDDDETIDCDSFKIIIDGMSVMYLLGTELDYKTELSGSSFVFNNPQATSMCGCQNSFAV